MGATPDSKNVYSYEIFRTTNTRTQASSAAGTRCRPGLSREKYPRRGCLEDPQPGSRQLDPFGIQHSDGFLPRILSRAALSPTHKDSHYPDTGRGHHRE